MKRHHRGKDQGEEEDSSSDEDAFFAFSRKKRKTKKVDNKNGKDKKEKNTSSSSIPQVISNNAHNAHNAQQKDDFQNVEDAHLNPNANNTSSNKRHHHHSSARAAKMDTLLQELEQTSKSTTATLSTPGKSLFRNGVDKGRPPPDKMGSFVSIDEEPFTTNIFVGNLSPLTTEEQLTEIFRQFGDLYSVKIMWPRTPEEHARGRNTGFVCFMNRDDAQEAMDAFQEKDPLRTGRRMCLRWGKNVKKTVKRGTGGVPIPPIRKKIAGAESIPNNIDETSEMNDETTQQNELPVLSVGIALSNDVVEYDKTKHFASAIKVIPPNDPTRLDFITTVASFVAKDGSVLERRLLEREKLNPSFSFLHHDCENKDERIFYRWRVFAFTQGDSFDSWRTDPFVMIQPNGKFWIPPPLDTEKALREKIENELKEDQIRIKQERRRKVAEKKDFMTGRQIESMKQNRRDGGMIRLRPRDLDYWNHMIEKKLCGSRDSICEVMAFCFEKSGAALHISELLKNILMDNRKGVSVETKIARLYLMSDILYNSQQPGVRNAFKYRDAIERMALEVFECLGSHGNGTAGRMTMNKLRNAVKAVLSAWEKWSVYTSTFLDQLEAVFEGKPFHDQGKTEIENKSEEIDEDIVVPDESAEEKIGEVGMISDETNTNKPVSRWVDKSETETDAGNNVSDIGDIDGEDLDEKDIENGFVHIDADLDGESLHESDLEEDSENSAVSN